MSLPHAEIGLLRDISVHSTCSLDDARKQMSFFASILSNKLSESRLQYNSDGETKSRNFISSG